MDLTSSRDALEAASASAVRMLPARRSDPLLSGLLLRADQTGLRIAGTDHERSVVNHVEAMVHTSGSVLVPGKPFAETVHALDSGRIRLTVEANTLVLRTPGARFALPVMDTDAHPGIPEPPELLGKLDAEPFTKLLPVIVNACSNDLALPMFTGVRLCGSDGVLRLVATDRYQLAVAELPWHGSDFDVLVPARILGELGRRVRGELRLHGDSDRFALGWSGGTVSTSLFATPFIDADRYLNQGADAIIEVDAQALSNAARRVGLFADGRGAVRLDLGEEEVRVQASADDGAGFGTAMETVKASVTGQLSQHFRANYLLGALRGFGAETVRLHLLSGMRRTLLDSPGVPELRYVIMPITGS